MINPRDEKIWADAFNSYLAARLDPGAARAKADEALKEYKERWPVEQSGTTPVAGLDAGMILRAVSQLQADRRVDAALILQSLYEALRETQASGCRTHRVDAATAGRSGFAAEEVVMEKPMEKIEYKRVVSASLEDGELVVGLAVDSQDAKIGKHDAEQVNYVRLSREYQAAAQLGTRVRVTTSFMLPSET